MSLERASVDWEGRVIAAMHALERAEADLAAGADDLTALQWDEASRALSAALVAQSGSRRLVGLQETFYNQSRRFRLALLREGRVDLSGRAARRGALRDAILARDTGRACAILDEDVRQDMAPASVS
jgi:DNA-binding GntR family transcriptional regulator